MRISDSSIGAIVAMSDKQRAFSPTDIELLHVVASQSALAVWRTNSLANGESDLIELARRKIAHLSL